MLNQTTPWKLFTLIILWCCKWIECIIWNWCALACTHLKYYRNKLNILIMKHSQRESWVITLIFHFKSRDTMGKHNVNVINIANFDRKCFAWVYHSRNWYPLRYTHFSPKEISHSETETKISSIWYFWKNDDVIIMRVLISL